jgi:signal transduction histidine kinase
MLINTEGKSEMYCIDVDLTERKQAEELVRRNNEALESRVQERTLALSQANEQLLVEIAAAKRSEAERKQAERALQEAKDQLQAILDAVPGCIFWVDSELRYLGVNRYMAGMFNCAPEDFWGQRVGFINKGSGLANFVQHFFGRSVTEVFEQVAEVETQVNGAIRSYLVVAQKLTQGQSAVFVGIDITERKQAEIETLKNLEREKQLGELKSRFTSMVSHEFRTPLSTIMISNELLEHYSSQWSEDKKSKYFRQIQMAVKHMTHLLDDILIVGEEDAASINKFNPTLFDVVAFCSELTDEIRLSLGAEHNFVFVCIHQNQDAFLDEKLLRLILSNLLSNATKYSPLHSTVTFRLMIEPESIIFEVEDEGIGIPEADQDKLFQLFHRATNVGTVAGTGLGLAIVKRSVDLHNGQVSFASHAGVGTKFRVMLPHRLA